MISKSHHFCLFVLLPILIGGLIYILFRSDKLLMFYWFKTIGIGQPIRFLRNTDFIKNSNVPNWIKYSLPDGLWIFSYVSSMILIWNYKISKISVIWIFILPVIAVSSEFGQLFKVVPGTFDINDLAIYLFSTLLPIVLFKYIFIDLKTTPYVKI
jgi:hypothetical protein